MPLLNFIKQKVKILNSIELYIIFIFNTETICLKYYTWLY